MPGREPPIFLCLLFHYPLRCCPPDRSISHGMACETRAGSQRGRKNRDHGPQAQETNLDLSFYNCVPWVGGQTVGPLRGSLPFHGNNSSFLRVCCEETTIAVCHLIIITAQRQAQSWLPGTQAVPQASLVSPLHR